MLYYDRDHVIKGTGTDGNNSKECIICHFQLVIHGFKFQNFVLNDCHDLTVLCLNLGNVTIITVKDADQHCIIHEISKSAAINLSKNYVLEDRGISKITHIKEVNIKN